MNHVLIAGTLKKKPKEEKNRSGKPVYWCSMTVADERLKKVEDVEIVVAAAYKPVLREAFAKEESLIVHGAIYTCDGIELDKPGNHRFVLAEEIAPLAPPEDD